MKPTVASRADVGAQLSKPGDAVLITRGQPRWLILRCPCGCGEDIPINLDQRAGKAWRYYEGGPRGATVFPSVWRDSGCESHFIIWGGRILLFDAYGDDETLQYPSLGDLVHRVLASWPAGALISYVDVADKMGEIPWDVLEACRVLTRHGALTEGTGRQRTMFRRR
ncbi:MAG: hypothetical protein IPL06_06320 [Betaproteobacteria bacterium]|nr:hypothetical protein [Betaproteobacteria bacterium]